MFKTVIQVSHSGYYQVAEMLLKSGADPNIQCIDGRTALTGATANNHFDTVELLLCYKANLHILFSPIGGEEGGIDSFGIAAARSHIES